MFVCINNFTSNIWCCIQERKTTYTSHAASASYSITVTAGFSYTITNWGSWEGKKDLESPFYCVDGCSWVSKQNEPLSGKTSGEMLYVCTTYADTHSGYQTDSWVEVELPAGKYHVMMSHTGKYTYLKAYANNSLIADIDKTGANATPDEGAVWLTEFSVGSGTKVKFQEMNQGGGYSRAQVWIYKIG